MSYRMIIRSNLNTQDMVINVSDPLETSLKQILTLNTDPSSSYFIQSEYLLFRLYDCVKRVLQTSFHPGNCPVMFDSWSCWNSTPPGMAQYERCPNFVNLGFRPDRFAEKYCREDGTWWVHPDTNRWDIVRGDYKYIIFDNFIACAKCFYNIISLFIANKTCTTFAKLILTNNHLIERKELE